MLMWLWTKDEMAWDMILHMTLSFEGHGNCPLRTHQPYSHNVKIWKPQEE